MPKTISKKSKMIAAVAFVLGSIAVGSYALADTTSPTNPMSSMVTAIAQKFNLNTSDVQAVVTQVMTEQHAQMDAQQQQAFATRVAAGVTAGKITQAQADLIIAKEKEIIAQRDALKNMTAAQRQAAIQTERQSLTSWITTNNIPKEFAFFGGRGNGSPRRQKTPTTN